MGHSDEDRPEFDKAAREYERFFAGWLRIAGASREHFARSRLNWLARLLRERGVTPRRVMDFGCGTGISLPLLTEILGAEQVIGLDTSEESIAVARETVRNERVQLGVPASFAPQGDVDLVFCNGVFHHIPVPERLEVANYIHRCLSPGGIFALWENNPWNPVHAFAMKHSEIDKNAIPLPPPESCRLLASAQFQVLRTDYLFFLPGSFRWLRSLERGLIKMPLGAQYQVFALKPNAATKAS